MLSIFFLSPELLLSCPVQKNHSGTSPALCTVVSEMRSQGVYKVLINSITRGQRKWNDYVLNHEIDDSHPWKRFNWAKQVHKCTWLTTELYRGRWASREKRIEAPWQHTEKCVQSYVNPVCGKQVSAHNSSSSQRRQLAALSITKFSLELLLMSSEEKVFCWEAQHCKQWGAYPWCPKVLPLSCCCFVFVFSVLFLNLSRKQCTLGRDVQKREIFISGADWCAHLAMVFSATVCPLELGSAALTANWRNEIPTPMLTGKWAAHPAVFSWRVISNLCSAWSRAWSWTLNLSKCSNQCLGPDPFAFSGSYESRIALPAGNKKPHESLAVTEFSGDVGHQGFSSFSNSGWQWQVSSLPYDKHNSTAVSKQKRQNPMVDCSMSGSKCLCSICLRCVFRRQKCPQLMGMHTCIQDDAWRCWARSSQPRKQTFHFKCQWTKICFTTIITNYRYDWKSYPTIKKQVLITHRDKIIYFFHTQLCICPP